MRKPAGYRACPLDFATVSLSLAEDRSADTDRRRYGALQIYPRVGKLRHFSDTGLTIDSPGGRLYILLVEGELSASRILIR